MTSEGLEEFKKLYKEEFGIELSNEEAIDKATKTLELVKVLLKPEERKKK